MTIKKISTILFSLLLSITTLVANPNFLIYETAPASVAVGGAHDLLYPNVPISRTYSGIYALKDKTEVAYYHSILPNSIAIENFAFGLKKDYFPGVKLGGYLSYVNYGGFSIRDDRARYVETIDVTDILIGIPVIFNVNTLNIKNPYLTSKQSEFAEEENQQNVSTDTNTKAGSYSDSMLLNKILYSINSGLNLNFYQSSLGTYKASTFFADFNLSGRFKVGYIGMPGAMITEGDLENEKNYLITQKDTSAAKKLEQKKEEKEVTEEAITTLEQELLTSRSTYSNELEKIYTQRKTDLVLSIEKKKNVYYYYNNQQIEISHENITNFIDTAKEEVNSLFSLASNTAYNNFSDQKILLNDEIDALQNEMSNYSAKFMEYSSDNPELMEIVNNIFDTYKSYIIERYKKILIDIVLTSLDMQEQKLTKSDSSQQRVIDRKRSILLKMKADYETNNKEYEEHTIQSNETYESLAQQYLNNTKEASKIIEYNNIKNKNEPLEIGQVLKIPTVDIEAKHAEQYKEFNTKKSALEKQLSQYDISEIQQFYYDNAITKLEKRSVLFQYNDVLNREYDAKIIDLKNKQTKQLNKFTKLNADLTKKLKEIKIRKELNNVNADTEKERNQIFNEYKKNERKIFKILVSEIYKSQKRIISEFIIEENDQRKVVEKNLKDKYEKMNENLKENYVIAKFEAKNAENANTIEGKENLKTIDEQYNTDKNKLDSDLDNEIITANQNIDKKVETYEWQMYITEITYLSTEERRDTMAVGFFVKNLGMPLTYTDRSTANSLPMYIGFDGNYEFLNTDKLNSFLYANYSMSMIEISSIGVGLMNRFAQIFELRTGVTLTEPSIVYAGSLAMLFNIGLMNYRVDTCVKMTPNYGLSYNVGLNIIF